MGLTEGELVAHAATTSEWVQELVELGILTKEADSDEPFGDGAVQRVRLVEELEGLGIPPARVAAAISNGALTLSYLDRLPAPPARLAETYAELCNKLEVPFALVDRIYASFGLPRPQPDERVREEDLAVITDLPPAHLRSPRERGPSCRPSMGRGGEQSGTTSGQLVS